MPAAHRRLQALALALLPLLPMAHAPAVHAREGQQEAKKSPPRTVSWYADNPQARARVQLACLDDPGHLANDPDCVNAQQASVEVALRHFRTLDGAKLGPDDPAFWSADPQSRHNRLIMCRLTPTVSYCDVARRSLLIEAGQDGR